MAVKKRNPLVLKIYYAAFIVMFIAWVIFALRHLSPSTALFYNFSSPAPATFSSHDDYIRAVKRHDEQMQRQLERERRAWERRDRRLGFGTGISHPFRGNWWDSRRFFRPLTNNEGYVIKNDGKYLYILSEHPSMILDTYPHILLEGAVVIVDAYPPGEMNVVSKIWLVSGESGKSNREYSDIYVSGDNLLILSIKYYYNNFYSVVTLVDIYDITDRNRPVHTRTFKLDGYFVSLHVRNDILYLFTVKNIWLNTNRYVWLHHIYIRGFSWYDFEPPEMTVKDRFIPYYYDTAHGGKRYVAADRLHTLFPNTAENLNHWISTVNIAAVDLTGSTPPNVSSYTYPTRSGELPRIYMSAENNIYLMRGIQENGISYTDILKLSVDKTDVRYAASGKVPGHIRNQDEYNGNFRIATTEWYRRSNVFIRGNLRLQLQRHNNYVFTLDSNLNFVSSVARMTLRERIGSVRFDGDMSYVTTRISFGDLAYSLFIIDLSEPESPEIKAELKLPQSMRELYLRSLGNGLLLGTGEYTVENERGGRDTAGVQAWLFDVSDPYNPKEISGLRLGGRSSRPIDRWWDSNQTSFLNIPSYSVFALSGAFTDVEQTEPTNDRRSQALIISYDKYDGLKLARAFDGVNIVDYNYNQNVSTMNRIAYINNIMYHFDGEAVHAYDMNDGFIKIGSIYYK